MSPSNEPPPAVIQSYGLAPESITQLASGLINRTFSVRRADDSACILQRVSSIFPPEVNDDIDAVTKHLSRKGLTAPLLIPTVDGRHYVSVDGNVWRLMTRIEGETVESVRSESQAGEAGRVLGEFHAALADFDGPLRCRRPGVHDIQRHLGNLRQVLHRKRGHAAQRAVTALAQRIFAQASRVQRLPESPLRLVHGDPKISNVIFDRGRGICLIDLDTIAHMPVALEFGDALRSWCNPAGEDAPNAHFSMARCEAALAGYRQAAPDLLSAQEWRAVPNATFAIAVELAARFAADALNDSYFAWDPARFESRSLHNQARAAAQLALALDIERQLRPMRERLVTLM